MEPAGNDPFQFFQIQRQLVPSDVATRSRHQVFEVNGKDARGPQAGGTSSGWFSQGCEATRLSCPRPIAPEAMESFAPLGSVASGHFSLSGQSAVG